jgi:hypothetical protein
MDDVNYHFNTREHTNKALFFTDNHEASMIMKAVASEYYDKIDVIS